jgi:hypothetical protein
MQAAEMHAWVGRENVMAGAEGARIASQELWGRRSAA